MQKIKFSFSGKLMAATLLGLTLTTSGLLTSSAEARPLTAAEQRRAKAYHAQRVENAREKRIMKAREERASHPREDLILRARQQRIEQARRDRAAQVRAAQIARARQQRIEAARRARQHHTSYRPNNYRPGNYRQTGYRPGGNVVIRGVVTRDLNGDKFAMRNSRDGEFTVVLTNGEKEPRSLERGSRVQVGGYFRGNTFYAYDVNI